MKNFILLMCSVILPFFLIYFIYLFYFTKIKKMKIPKQNKKIKKESLLDRIYFQFPKRLILDKIEREEDTFMESGFKLICGEQGAGKTIFLVKYLQDMQKKYPKLQVKTNMNYIYENDCISSWQDIVFSNNGIYGQIDVLDEIQAWFNSLESKDFPPEMLAEISQQRKQRKVIIGTAQVFSRVAKPLREQCTELFEPITVFGCLTIVRKYKPVFKDDATVDEKKLRGISFFIHSPIQRESFDTYKKIEIQSLKGFKPINEQMALKQQNSCCDMSKDKE